MGIAIKDLGRRIAEIPSHTNDLPEEAASPFEHYQLGSREAWNLLQYFGRKVASTKAYAGPLTQHTTNLRNMTILALMESFERYLKEAAATCVDLLVPYLVDDRVDCLGEVSAARAVAHFEERTVGRAVAEATMWSRPEDIDGRFNKLLATLYVNEASKWSLLPTSDKVKDPDYWRRTSLGILFQLRHTIAHNVGLVTRSDGLKFRRLTKREVAAPRMLAPTNGDVWYAKVFLDETVLWLNGRICERLSVLLAQIHDDDPGVLDLNAVTSQIASAFRRVVTIGGVIAHPG